MLIVGAGGHAKEILDILIFDNPEIDVVFYDDITPNLPNKLYGKYKIIKSLDEAKDFFSLDSRFILGIGSPYARKQLADKFIGIGGKLESVISATAQIGKFNISLGEGINIMHNVLVSSNVKIGDGTLINAHSTVHHDTIIGKYCEISPGVHITGWCKIGDYCSIGTGAIILPKIKIGEYSVIGAGAVVVSDIPDKVVTVGVPAKVIKSIKD